MSTRVVGEVGPYSVTPANAQPSRNDRDEPVCSECATRISKQAAWKGSVTVMSSLSEGREYALYTCGATRCNTSATSRIDQWYWRLAGRST